MFQLFLASVLGILERAAYREFCYDFTKSNIYIYIYNTVVALSMGQKAYITEIAGLDGIA